MSSPHMSFRLNNYQLAKMLRILLTLEPNQPIASLSQAAKIIIIDWISKHSINSTLTASQADIDAIKLISKLSVDQIDPYSTIKNIMAQANQQYNPQAQQLKQKSMQQIQREIEDERIFNEIKQEEMKKAHRMEKQAKLDSQDNDLDEQIKLSFQSENRTNSILTKDLPTSSIVTTVTDFSPPKDWTES